jgi:hypothetical protein
MKEVVKNVFPRVDPLLHLQHGRQQCLHLSLTYSQKPIVITTFPQALDSFSLFGSSSHFFISRCPIYMRASETSPPSQTQLKCGHGPHMELDTKNVTIPRNVTVTLIQIK